MDKIVQHWRHRHGTGLPVYSKPALEFIVTTRTSDSSETEVADIHWSSIYGKTGLISTGLSFNAGQAVVNVAAEAVVSVDAGVDDDAAPAVAVPLVVAVEGVALLGPQPEKLATLGTLLGRVTGHYCELPGMAHGTAAPVCS